MSHAEEIQRRLATLKTAAQDFNQMVNLIDGNFDTKITEIKSLEMRRDKIRDEIDEYTRKSQSVIQEASEEASNMRKEASQLLTDARIAQAQAKSDKEDAIKVMNEAKALMTQAQQRQKEADMQYKIYSDKVESLKKAVSA
jgi:chromosome segregation ATPase